MKLLSKEFLFTIRGRATRSQYWAFFGIQLASSLLVLAIAAVLGQLGTQFSPESAAAGIAAILAIAVLFGGWFVLAWANICVSIKRLHDTGKSGTWLWLSLVPFAGLFLFFLLGCEAGTPGTNRFGRASTVTNNWGDVPALT